ncbi:MAG: hypothetical protein N3F03_06510 [Ignavibacteria bacterium]|nr:hypothetical protein [Ignavibacteria bacterium]
MKAFLIILLSFASLQSQVKDIFEYGSKVNDLIAREFSISANIENNINQVDKIFSFALSIADSNIADALLFCSIGTMTYPVFKAKIPLISLTLPFSFFTKYNEDLLKRKTKNLPSKLFEDSPSTEFGDKDKLVHFFLTAYLSYVFGKNFSEEIGKFVEVFEEDFKIDGRIDERDLKINQLGAEFGEMLHYKIIFPSFILAKEKSLSYGKNSDN